MSEIMQLGSGCICLSDSSNGSCSIPAATKKFFAKFLEIVSRFSHPSGNPASAHGNRSWRR